MVRRVYKNEYQKDACLEEIRLRIQNMLSI